MTDSMKCVLMTYGAIVEYIVQIIALPYRLMEAFFAVHHGEVFVVLLCPCNHFRILLSRQNISVYQLIIHFHFFTVTIQSPSKNGTK